jgi:hypothetical protein
MSGPRVGWLLDEWMETKGDHFVKKREMVIREARPGDAGST